MPKRKIDKEKQKMQDIEIKQENKQKPIQWNELDKYIGQPVWDTREKRWRILDGYRRTENTFSITFSDIVDWVSYCDRFLYSEEIKGEVDKSIRVKVNKRKVGNKDV